MHSAFAPGKFFSTQFSITLIFAPPGYLSATIREFPRAKMQAPALFPDPTKCEERRYKWFADLRAAIS